MPAWLDFCATNGVTTDKVDLEDATAWMQNVKEEKYGIVSKIVQGRDALIF